MNMQRRTFLFFLILAFLRPSHGAQPWDSAFNSDIRAIITSAETIKPSEKSEAVIFLEDHKFTIKKDGRIETALRKVFRVDKQDAVEEWSSFEYSFRPWHQDSPELRARVIGKDGTVKWLDTKTISTAPTRQFDASIFSDERVLRAPLPAVAVGSIVEWEVLLRDRTPLFEAGNARRVSAPTSVPINRFHVVIDAEPGVELRLASQLIPSSAIRRASSANGDRVECELASLQPNEKFDSNLPFDTSSSPYLAFSTGRSWQAIASKYSQIVSDKVSGHDLKAVMEGIDLNGSPLELAARLTERLHKLVRYTGVEFGEAAIIPATVGETIKRGYGDCKDKSTLLVAMLRAAGLKADVALLNSGFGVDIEVGLPGFGHFNHAIVHVAANPPLWIDATAADTRVGYLPTADEGRLALIANGSATSLTTIPVSESSQNWEHQRVDVFLSETGAGRFKAVIEVGGATEPGVRAMFGKEPNKPVISVEEWTKQNFAAKSMGQFEPMARNDFSGPFKMTVEALDSRLSMTGQDDAGVALTPALLFNQLPYELTKAKEENESQARKHDFVIHEAYQKELQYLIHPPTLFKASKIPDSGEEKLGTATLSRKYRVLSDGTLEATYKFDSGKRRLNPEEFQAMRKALEPHMGRISEVVTFVPETTELMALGQTTKAIQLLKDEIQRNPQKAIFHIRLANLLLAAGFGDVAMEEANAAVKAEPSSTHAWHALGITYQHDTLGRLRKGPWRGKEAEAAFRKAVELDSENALVKFNLAILLEYNDQGFRYGKGWRSEDAIQLYKEVMKVPDHLAAVEQNLALAYIRSGQYGKAIEVLGKINGEVVEVL